MTAAASFWVPGRIEFLGKHTDYAGGRSLLCAVDRGISLEARRRPDRRLRIVDAATGEVVECLLDASISPHEGHWAIYPMTVARRVARNFPGTLAGADMTFRSNLPQAAGMSSSSALVVAVFLALSAINELPLREEYRANIRSTEDLAGYLGCVEGGYDFGELGGDSGVGTLSGCEDQTAMLCSRAGALVRFAFCPVRFEGVVPLPPGSNFAIAVSGVRAEKTARALAQYNRLARLARAAYDAWQRATGRDDASLGAALSAGAGTAQRIREVLRAGEVDGFSPAELGDRFEQFVEESEVLVPAAATALAAGDITALGALVDRSQRGAERFLGNQIPETIALARSARGLGAAAASAFGAGFGGSVWALVMEGQGADFLASWRATYLKDFPMHAATAEFFITTAGPPAERRS